MEIFFLKKPGDEYYLTENNSILFIATCKYRLSEKSIWDNKKTSVLASSIISSEHKNSFLSAAPFLIELCNKNDKYDELLLYHTIFPYPKYEFVFNNESYVIYHHLGTKASFYKNGIQIGYYDTEFSSNEYFGMKVVMDDGYNKELICIICLSIYSNFTQETLDTGGRPNYNLSLEGKKFNKDWKPK